MNFKIVGFILIGMLIFGGVYFFGLRTEPVESITEKWNTAGHADRTSVSFTNWDENEPPEVPIACAKCHSMYGYLDYLGADGTEAGSVDAAAPIGSVVSCNTCHNEPAHAKTTVVFPSGEELPEVDSAVCMDCHQGRASTGRVNDAIAGIPLDTVSEELSFINVHYAIGAATLMGGDARVGYQYEGREYVSRFEHSPQYDTCIDCHDPHSTAIDPQKCSPCHLNVVGYGDMFQIRTSDVDYDGDGDTDEGIMQEIATLHSALYEAIRTYSAEVVGTPIAYADAFPYFFVDEDGDGELGPGEAIFPNRYQSWTPRLLQAAYNYHYELEDPGSFTHNARYVIQLLHDSLESLSEQVEVDMEGMVRP